MNITPRGGAQEVGRSCYQVDAGDRTYLVDCGIKQSMKAEYPDFQGLDSGAIDAVFVTHAHIDHIGALPVAERRGLLADDAPIITTRPTDALATILLSDSLKIHKLECAEFDRQQQFTDQDVRAVLDRIEGRGYGRGECYNVEYVFGNAGHLLGSAWLALEHNSRRIVFSGDLGGRSAHLPAIEEPPTADTLLLESTYGNILDHRAFTDARIELFDLVTDALAAERPVLIPTFGVGRSQEVLQLFREREDELVEAADGDPRIVYDGMIRSSTPIYNVFATDEYVQDSLINYRINSQDTEPFLPDCAWTPETMPKRWGLLDGDRAPIIVSPSGMLTGGWSPFYLWEFTRHYEDAHVAFIGYQAHGTPGRELLEASGDKARVEITALMHGDQSDDPDASGFAFHRKEITVPTHWVQKIDGLSGHAAGNGLLQFARETDPTEIHLVHGERGAEKFLCDYLGGNTDAEDVALSSQGEEIEVGRSGAIPSDIDQLQKRCDRLRQELDELEEDLNAFRNQ
jgi:predicted metal-dependent RNase